MHEAQPNAFATPGGNVYVVDSLLYFARNTEELAGTLCHEVSHTIHRDSVELMKKKRQITEEKPQRPSCWDRARRSCSRSSCSAS